MRRLLALPDHVVVYPSHYGGSVCGRGLSGNPISSIGFERPHNRALATSEAEAFADALLEDLPPAPPDQARDRRGEQAGRAGAGLAPRASRMAKGARAPMTIGRPVSHIQDARANHGTYPLQPPGREGDRMG